VVAPLLAWFSVSRHNPCTAFPVADGEIEYKCSVKFNNGSKVAPG
jgi:hypothetical protein